MDILVHFGNPSWPKNPLKVATDGVCSRTIMPEFLDKRFFCSHPIFCGDLLWAMGLESPWNHHVEFVIRTCLIHKKEPEKSIFYGVSAITTRVSSSTWQQKNMLLSIRFQPINLQNPLRGSRFSWGMGFLIGWFQSSYLFFFEKFPKNLDVFLLEYFFTFGMEVFAYFQTKNSRLVSLLYYHQY